MPTNLKPGATDDGQPIKFLATWGLLAFLMLYTHTRMAAHDGKIASGFQFEDLEQPAMMAGVE